MHAKALTEIEKIKGEAQKKHDEINKATRDATDKVILTASHSVLGLDGDKPKAAYWDSVKKWIRFSRILMKILGRINMYMIYKAGKC